MYSKDLLSLLNADEYSQSIFEKFAKTNNVKDKIFNTNIKSLHPTLKKMFDN